MGRQFVQTIERKNDKVGIFRRFFRRNSRYVGKLMEQLETPRFLAAASVQVEIEHKFLAEALGALHGKKILINNNKATERLFLQVLAAGRRRGG